MRFIALISSLAMLASVSAAYADDDIASFKVAFKDHRISPAVLNVPADKRFKLDVTNEDATPEEIESQDLDFEQIVPAGDHGTVYVRPLSAGKYHYYGDFHQDTAQADIIAK